MTGTVIVVCIMLIQTVAILAVAMWINKKTPVGAFPNGRNYTGDKMQA